MLQNRWNREQLYCTAEYWDSKAVEYEGDAISMWPNNHLNYYYHREQLSLLEQYLPCLDEAKVLDIGCGTGRISRYLAKRGATVLGIDFSSNAIAIAQKQSPTGNPHYRVQSLFDLEDDSGFDILVSWGSITVACKNRVELLDVMPRLRKSLRSNGKALFLEPIHKGFLHRVLNMTVQEFCDVMDEAGFNVEAVSHLHFWPMRLGLSYINWPKPITTAGYYFGEGIMNLLGRKSFGDYKAIFATAKNRD
ncbi:MAG: class I SAM-dependent methyltransferase [Leptolyngbyaceae cyanobacterium RU_5_1]|nr:class I SAM-dependent methyltransferase [Leptolyngbyaceae cyanobacterium RU_5_1]